MKENSSIDPAEMAKFAQHASQWWDPHGSLKTLHDINPVRLALIKQYVPLMNSRILDIGCGGGILAEAMAKEGAVVTGLDAEPHAIDAARHHAEGQHLQLNYQCMPIEEFEATPFDCITCLELLEHTSDPEKIIASAAGLLKNQGYLFLSTIHRTIKSYLSVIIAAEYVFSLLPRQTHDFDKFIRPSELAHLLRKTGFELIALKGMDYNPLTRQASLSDNTQVNYLVVARRTE
jgi:2-polyprenyl-6-hydroxyphenyl methylase/3-demethylubiquinone-9 3-methyltransferase